MSAHPIGTGFWGKIPSRGDFVRVGLSRAFTDAWDAWFSAMLAGSRAALGDAWQAAWMVAPVWRFCLQPGLCGPDAMLGLWMPSVDSAGRAYPLTLAAPLAQASDPDDAAEAWLDRTEDAGRAALSEQLDPETLAQRLAAPPPPATPLQDRTIWWKEHPQPAPFRLPAMPTQAHFIQMLA